MDTTTESYFTLKLNILEFGGRPVKTKTIAVAAAAAAGGEMKQYLLLFLLKSVIVFLQNFFKVNFLQKTTKLFNTNDERDPAIFILMVTCHIEPSVCNGPTDRCQNKSILEN